MSKDMFLSMVITSALVFILLVLIGAMRPHRSALSFYELRRRVESGSNTATAALRRKELFAQFDALKPAATSLLIVALTLCLLAGLGWWGAPVAMLSTLLAVKLSHVKAVDQAVRKLCNRREAVILDILERHKKIVDAFMLKEPEEGWAIPFGSREELLHLVAHSGSVLTPDDKERITRSMTFPARRIDEFMTPREQIVSIEHTELLGPLVLSDLHKTGHSCFPVIVKDVDHIVGMLDIRRLVTLEAKRSLTAAKAMSGQAGYIRNDQTLDGALAAFVRTRQHLLVVINEGGVTVGLLGLRDVLEALLGCPMADEFASDEDLHLVAKRRL